MSNEDKKLVNMEGLEIALTDFKTQMFLAVYPIGSIYMSISETAPGTLFGGTWQRIEDIFLLSAGQTYEAGATGGNALTTLLEANLPSHSHSINISTNTANCSNLTLIGTAASAGSHSHTFSNGEAAEAGGHSHTFSNGSAASAGAHGHTFTGTAVNTNSKLSTHSHTVNTHDHSIPALSGSTSSDGLHYHSMDYAGKIDTDLGDSISFGHSIIMATGAEKGTQLNFRDVIHDAQTTYEGTHSHTVSTSASTTGGSAPGTDSVDLSHTHSVTAKGTISNTDGAHTHTVTGTISSNGAHTHTVTGTIESAGTHTHDVEVSGGIHSHSISYTGDTGNTGSGTSFNNMPPYLAVYTWKRIA